MDLNDIDPKVLDRVKKIRWDRIIDKHEGPENWKFDLEGNYVDFLKIESYDVLLPIDKENHSNLSIDRCIPSTDGKTLTIFLQDATYDSGIFAGYMAVCEKFPEQEWFIAILYHECWISKLELSD